MKRADWTDRTMATLNTKNPEEVLNKLNSGCDYYVTAGKCNGRRCESCPIQLAKNKLREQFVIPEPVVDGTAPVTVNITVEPKGKAVFNFKGNTFRWV